MFEYLTGVSDMHLAAIVSRTEIIIGPGPKIPMPTNEARIAAAREILRRDPNPEWREGRIRWRTAWWAYAHRAASKIVAAAETV